MPRYYFGCECSNSTAVIRPAAKQHDPVFCDQCGKQMKRTPRGATSRIIETLDNGLMSRRVERPADAERLTWERAHQKEDRDP